MPPVMPASVPAACSVPVTLVTPAEPPSSTISPLRSTSELARMTPELLTTVSSKALALRAVRRTLPPSASMRPLLMAEAFSAA